MSLERKDFPCAGSIDLDTGNGKSCNTSCILRLRSDPGANKRTYKRLYVLLNLYERLYVVSNLHVCLSVLQNLHGRLYVHSYVLPNSFVHWYVKRKYNNNCPSTPQTPFSMAWDKLHGHSRVVAHSLRSGRNAAPPILQYPVRALMVGPYANSSIIH